MNIIMFGLPGSGKGTQAALMSNHFDIVHVSFGDVLRRHIAEETAIGKNVKNIIANGDLVGIDIMQDILEDVLTINKTHNGIILDGFPRSVEQAQLLDRIFEERNKRINAIVHLVASDDLVKSRIAHRAKLQNRVDDQSIEKVNNRLAVYKNETKNVYDYYKPMINVHEINGEQEIEKVFSDIKEKLLIKKYDI